MPTISTSVSSVDTALTITNVGSYFISPDVVLESTGSATIFVTGGAGRVALTVGGHLVASPNFFTVYVSDTAGPLFLRYLEGSSSFGGAILSSARALQLVNDGSLFGIDAGILGSGLADTISNGGDITVADASVAALDLSSGNDTVMNSGLITGDVHLGADNDRFFGAGGTVYGSVFGDAGNDTFDLRQATITGNVAGGTGDDTFIIDDSSVDLIEASGAGIDGVKTTVSWQLGDNFETLLLLGANAINGYGNDLANTVTGNAGNNVIAGKGGADRLIGGGGRDVFDYNSVTESAYSTYDRITDLGDEDKIDLSGIDANAATKGNQAFALVNAFTHVAGQITLTYNSGADYTLLAADVNGDGIADMRIVLNGNHVNFTNFVF